MKEEVLAAVMFIVRFIEKSEAFPRDKIENFKGHLTTLLLQRFEKHWFPEIPAKGQGYRCIRLNVLSPVDHSIELAASRCGLSYRDLSLPTELTVWVDPSEVCYRLGESEGSYCTLATFPLDTSSSSSSSESSTSSSPLPSPPTTPTQEKYRRAHLLRQQQRVPTDGTTKYRNFNFNSSHAVASLRSKPVSREMSFNYQNRPPWRCDPAPFPLPPAIYRNYNNNYNTRQYKNVLKV